MKIEPLYWLLLAIPVTLAAAWLEPGGLWVFLSACVAIIPLAGLMGRATENLSHTLGPAIGGLLNATFGNAAELILGLLALRRGEIELVKASLTGSIIGNILLVMGLAILLGGFKYKRQTFNATAASLGATLLALASIGLVVPTLFFYLLPAEQRAQPTVEFLSEEIAGILALLYVLSLVFTLKTHQHLFAGEAEEQQATVEWSRKTSMVVLLAATAGVAVISELLVGSVEHAAQTLGMNRVFIGVIVVAMVGNAAEHSTAVLVALKNKMDLAVTIAIGSSIQIALFVAPVFVFAGLLLGQPMDLHFSPLEVVAVVVSIAVVALVSQDGETHWMEGALLLAVYGILALAFFHFPATATALD